MMTTLLLLAASIVFEYVRCCAFIYIFFIPHLFTPVVAGRKTHTNILTMMMTVMIFQLNQVLES